MTYPAGITAIFPPSISGRGEYPEIIHCEICEREVERNRNTGKWWFSDSLQVECAPTWVGYAFLCSDRCQSQHAYNLGTDKDRELMNALARMCHAWQEEQINPESHSWCLRHLHSGLAVDRSTLSNIHDGLQNLLKGLAGQGYFDGKEDAPEWYADAIAPVVPAKPVEFVHLGIGGSR